MFVPRVSDAPNSKPVHDEPYLNSCGSTVDVYLPINALYEQSTEVRASFYGSLSKRPSTSSQKGKQNRRRSAAKDDDEGEDDTEANVLEPYYDQPLVFTGAGASAMKVLSIDDSDPRYSTLHVNQTRVPTADVIYEQPVTHSPGTVVLEEPSQYSHLNRGSGYSGTYENYPQAIELRSPSKLANGQENIYSRLSRVTESSVDEPQSAVHNDSSLHGNTEDDHYGGISRKSDDEEMEPDNETYARLTARTGSMSYDRKVALYENTVRPPPGKYEELGGAIPENDEVI